MGSCTGRNTALLCIDIYRPGFVRKNGVVVPFNRQQFAISGYTVAERGAAKSAETLRYHSTKDKFYLQHSCINNNLPFETLNIENTP